MSFFFPCKYKKLINALKKFNLDIQQRAKHTKAECVHNGKKTTIPRHNNIKREVVKKVCDFLLEKEIEEKDIIKYLS